MRCLRIILRMSVRDKLRNVEIRARAGVMTVESMVRRRTLQWLGNLSRMDLSRVPRQLMVCCPEGGKCMPGGQKLRWNDVVSKDLKKGELLSDWRQIAKDRREWKSFVNALVEDMNVNSEVLEKQQKDEQKKRQEEVALLGFQWPCGIRGCAFNAQSKLALLIIRGRSTVLKLQFSGLVNFTAVSSTPKG